MNELSTSLSYKPDDDVVLAMLRLKREPDFQKFMEYMVQRTEVLALMSCNPGIPERVCTQLQGRVNEIESFKKFVDKTDNYAEQIEAARRKSGGV